jgi:hypothetical protein
MKSAFIIFLLAVNSVLLSLFTSGQDSLKLQIVFPKAADSVAADTSGLGNELPALTGKNSRYTITCSLQPHENRLVTTERLTWFNNERDSISTMYFHLYPNAFKSNHTIFAQDREIPAKSFTSMEINSVLINNVPVQLEYVNTEVNNPNDSTVARVVLPRPLRSRDSVVIIWQYTMKIPRAFCRLGSDPSKSFYSIADWLIKPGVLRNGKWKCGPYYPYCGFNSDFADYSVTIRVPGNFKIATSGDLISSQNANGDTTAWLFNAKNVSDFSWFVSSRFEELSLPLDEKTGLRVNYLVPSEYKKFIPRYTQALEYAYAFLKSTYGDFPEKQCSFVIASEYIKDMYPVNSPQLSVLSHKYLTPEGELLPERMIIGAFVEQYLNACISCDNVSEAWLNEGLTAYLTNYILGKYYASPNSYVYFFDVYPIKGLSLIQFADIPLVYTLSRLNVPPYAEDLQNYYSYAVISSLAENSSVYHSKDIFASATASRGAVFFHSMQNLLGEARLHNFIRGFLHKNKLRYPDAQELLCTARSYSSDAEFSFINQFYEEGGFSDYSILSVKQIATNSYAVHVANLGNIAYPVHLQAYTESDTLDFSIDPYKKLQTVYCKTNSPAKAFIIDPAHENLFDLSFANNSYTLDTNYGSSLYLSLRWFYWMQSIFLIFGGLS